MNRSSIELISIFQVLCCLQCPLFHVSYLICYRSSPFILTFSFSLRFRDPLGRPNFRFVFIRTLHDQMPPLGVPGVLLHFTLWRVCHELWHLSSDFAKLDLSVGKSTLPTLKIDGNMRWLKLSWAFFWQEYIGQEILRRAQHWITSYHSAWLVALILQLDSLRRNCWQRD